MALTTPHKSQTYADMMKQTEFHRDDVFIAVMGATGAGKTTFISKCCQQAGLGVGHGLQSETKEVNAFNFMLRGRKVHLFDTPGFDDTYRTDSDVLRDLAYWLTKSYSAGFELNGVVYLHPITANRMTGSAHKNLRTFQKLCGTDSMDSVVLATTMWSDVTPEAGARREEELRTSDAFWGNMILNGSVVYKHENHEQSAMNIISYFLGRNKRTVLELQREMVDDHIDLDHTEAGQEVEREMTKQRQVFERRLRETEEQMRQALRENDQRHIDEIAREQEKFKSDIKAIQNGRDELKLNMEKLIHDKEEKLAEIDRKLKEAQDEREKSVKDFEEYKEFQRIRQEQDDQKKKDLEVQLEAAKENASVEDAENTLLFTKMLVAMKEQQEEAQRREAILVEEARQRKVEAEQRQAAMERQMAQLSSMQSMSNQQAYYNSEMARANTEAWANAGLFGGAAVGAAIVSGCSVM